MDQFVEDKTPNSKNLSDRLIRKFFNACLTLDLEVVKSLVESLDEPTLQELLNHQFGMYYGGYWPCLVLHQNNTPKKFTEFVQYLFSLGAQVRPNNLGHFGVDEKDINLAIRADNLAILAMLSSENSHEVTIQTSLVAAATAAAAKVEAVAAAAAAAISASTVDVATAVAAAAKADATAVAAAEAAAAALLLHSPPY
jgi:hypothetical protein